MALKATRLDARSHYLFASWRRTIPPASPLPIAIGSSVGARVAQRRSLATSDVDDVQIAQLASKPLHPLTLADLVRHGRPPLSNASLLSSANFSLSLIPVRLAHRLQALRNLPFIVVSNPHISKIYNTYLHSLSTLLPYSNRSIQTIEEEIQFTEVMADLVQTHSNTIPYLARGFLESRRYIAPSQVTHFLEEHLRARIGTRLIAEQHIALHLSSTAHCRDASGSLLQGQDSASHIGVIDTALKPAETVRHCEAFVGEICELKYGVRPTVIINGQPETRLAHVPTHLEYIITELLKNAFRATVERGKEREPIEITIAASSPPSISTQSSTAYASKHHEDGIQRSLESATPGVTIRIRDRGGGISPQAYPNIWSYSFTTVNEGEVPSSPSPSVSPNAIPSNGNSDALNAISGAGGEGSSLAGLGYGLPLGRAYAEHFGGGIWVESLWGWGTDVYLKVRGLGGV